MLKRVTLKPGGHKRRLWYEYSVDQARKNFDLRGVEIAVEKNFTSKPSNRFAPESVTYKKKKVHKFKKAKPSSGKTALELTKEALKASSTRSDFSLKEKPRTIIPHSKNKHKSKHKRKQPFVDHGQPFGKSPIRAPYLQDRPDYRELPDKYKPTKKPGVNHRSALKANNDEKKRFAKLKELQEQEAKPRP